MSGAGGRRGAPEKAVEAACMRLCRLKGWEYYHLSQPRASMQSAGLPDMFVFINQRMLAVECKSATGRQTPAQRTFQWACEAAGVRYVVVRSAAELATEVEALG